MLKLLKHASNIFNIKIIKKNFSTSLYSLLFYQTEEERNKDTKQKELVS